MAVLINGNGNDAIYAQQDADWFASIMGNQTAITAIGSKFAATLVDANTIGVADGVIITQEGRRIQLDVNEIDLFDIPAGGQGETNYYIIGYHLVTGDLSEQYCETFVRLMDNDTDTIPEDTFRSGADEIFVSLYRVTQDNLAITDMELLLPELTTVSQLSRNLTAQDNLTFRFASDGEGNHGYLGADDSFIPFKSGYSYIGGWLGSCENTSAQRTGDRILCYDIENNDYKIKDFTYVYGTTYTAVDNDYMKITVLNQWCTILAKVDCTRLNPDGTTTPISANTSLSATYNTNNGKPVIIAV